MMRFLLAAFLYSVAAQAQQAAPGLDCVEQLEVASRALARAEALGSSGQLQSCIPTTDASKGTARIFQKLESARQKLDADFTRYQHLQGLFQRAQSDLKAGGGNICGATDKVKEDVQSIQNDLGAVSGDVSVQVNAVDEARKAFEQQYANRSVLSRLEYPKKTPNCVDTKSNAATIQQLLVKSVKTCADAHRAGPYRAAAAAEVLGDLDECTPDDRELRDCAVHMNSFTRYQLDVYYTKGPGDVEVGTWDEIEKYWKQYECPGRMTVTGG